MGKTVKPADVDGYIAASSRHIRPLLKKVRRTIRAAAPKATEVISYNMPAFKQHGMLVYFAGFKGHIGLYPPILGNAVLAKAAARYAGPKGNLKFPYDQPLPLGLITRIVRHYVKEDAARARARKKK